MSEDRKRLATLERVASICPSLQRVTWPSVSSTEFVIASAEMGLHLLLPRMKLTSLSSCPHLSPSIRKDGEACARLRHLRLDQCRLCRYDFSSPPFYFPVMETLTVCHGDTLPLNLLLGMPRLHTLRITSMYLNSTEMWISPPHLTTLEYCDIEYPMSTKESPCVVLLGHECLQELHISSHLLSPPSPDSRLISLPALTDLSLCVDLPLRCTLMLPALLRLHLYVSTTTTTTTEFISTFDCRRLIFGTVLHSCCLHLRDRAQTIRALTHLATVPLRPGCVVNVGTEFGSFGEQRKREMRSRSKRRRLKNRIRGGEDGGRRRRREEKEKDHPVVWWRSRWRSYPDEWYEHVARRDVLQPPRRFHSSMSYYLDSDNDEVLKEETRETLPLPPVTTRLLPVVQQLVQQGVIMLQEEFVVQYACPTHHHPGCLCQMILPASPSF